MTATNISGWDRYRQIRELGHGVHGRVVLCEDLTKVKSKSGLSESQQQQPPPHQFVAIKIVSLAGASESESRTALREVAILTSVNHPNILRMFEYFVDKEEQLCIVTEYIDGGDLSELIAKMNQHNHHQNKHGNNNNATSPSPLKHHDGFDDDNDSFNEKSPFPRAKLRGRFFVDAIVVADIAEQLLKAIAHLHRNNIVHADIKPQNVLLTRDGVVKVADFSISRTQTIRGAGGPGSPGSANSSKNYSSAAKFTPLTMSPEVASGLRATFSSDLWSLGVTLFELWVGEVPFNAGNLLALVAKICEGKYDSRLLYARPYSGMVPDETLNDDFHLGSPSSATAKNISEHVQREVCTAVCQIIEALLTLNAEERPTASELLIRFFTSDADPTAGGSDAAARAGMSRTNNSNNNATILSATSASSPDQSSNAAAAAAAAAAGFGGDSAERIKEEMLSVVRSSCGSKLSFGGDAVVAAAGGGGGGSGLLDCETDFVQLGASSCSEATGAGSGNPSHLSRGNDNHAADASRQGYEDDFEDLGDEYGGSGDILSVSYKARASSVSAPAMTTTTTTTVPSSSTSSGAPASSGATNKIAATSTAHPDNNNNNNDNDSAKSQLAAAEDRVNHLPWFTEAALMANLPVDASNGHDPIYFHAYSHHHHHDHNHNHNGDHDDHGDHGDHADAAVMSSLSQLGEDPLMQVAEAMREQHARSLSPAAAQQQQQMLRHAQNLRYHISSSGGTSHHHQPHQLHRGSCSGLVVEMTPASALVASKRRGSSTSGSLTPGTASAMTSLQSQHHFMDPSAASLSNTASAAVAAAMSNAAAASAAVLSTTKNAAAAAAAAASDSYNEALMEQIRNRAMIVHKKRLAALAKDREEQLEANQNKKQEQQQQSSSSSSYSSAPVTGSSPASSSNIVGRPPLALKPLSTTLLGQKRTAEDEQRELMLLGQKKPSAVLMDIVMARQRGLISGALVSAFPHLYKKPQEHHHHHSKSKKNEEKPASGSSSDDDEEEDEEDEEEEEEEEEELADDEFKVKIFFSAATATKLRAVPFAGKVASAVPQQPATSFPAFSISARLNFDAPYKELLKAVQDQVIFFGAAAASGAGGNAGGSSSALLLSLAGTVTINNKSMMSASYKVLSACVPLQFEFHDQAEGGSGDKIVFSRKADWAMIRDLHLDQDDSAVMELNALPR